MNLDTLVQSLIQDTQGSLPLFLPELVLCGTILVMLLVRVFPFGQKIESFHLALIGVSIALWYALPVEGAVEPRGLFTHLVVYDAFTIFFRCLLLLFAVMFCILTRITGLSEQEDGPDFFTLVLGAILGMCLMASANHLLMVFLAIEMASVPSYVLAGVLKGDRKGSEASLKYVVFGAGAAGIMLYGISLLCGILGSAHFPTMAQNLAALNLPEMIATGTGAATIRVLALGGLMVMVGLAFKLSVVPFHFWCPDVFEGASAEIAAFLSVASKAAALALLVRLAIGFGYVRPSEVPLAPAATQTAGLFNVAEPPAPAAIPLDGAADEATGVEPDVAPAFDSVAALAPVRSFIVQLLAFLAAITCTFGNLAAFGQRNIKRLLAYSTIAHAGYMLMPVAAAVAAIGVDQTIAAAAISALTFYIVLYMFMNLAAFAMIAFLRNAMGSEQISDYAGLIHRAPVTVICFSIVFFSLIGLPPLAGFAGKYTIFLSLVEVGGPTMYTLLFIASLNTAVSLVYYLRVVKVMTFDPEPDSRGPVALPFIPTAYTVAVSLPVLILGIWWDAVYRFAEAATRHMFS